MKRILSLLIFSLLAGAALAPAAGAAAARPELVGVQHFRQSTVRFSGEKVIYCDPYKVEQEPHDADLILVTHPHGDHLSLADLRKVMKPGALVVIPPDAEAKLRAEGFTRLLTVVPGKEYEALGVRFATVPAYNTNKPNHPKTNNWVGYLLYLGGRAYYLAGDTDVIPEMEVLKVDVAFLPVGGKYTMTADEAVRAADLIRPAVAVPIHFLDAVGTWADAEKFVSSLDPAIAGVILKQR